MQAPYLCTGIFNAYETVYCNYPPETEHANEYVYVSVSAPEGFVVGIIKTKQTINTRPANNRTFFFDLNNQLYTNKF
jgi:hypothetical protein